MHELFVKAQEQTSSPHANTMFTQRSPNVVVESIDTKLMMPDALLATSAEPQQSCSCGNIGQDCCSVYAKRNLDSGHSMKSIDTENFGRFIHSENLMNSEDRKNSGDLVNFNGNGCTYKESTCSFYTKLEEFNRKVGTKVVQPALHYRENETFVKKSNLPKQIRRWSGSSMEFTDPISGQWKPKSFNSSSTSITGSCARLADSVIQTVAYRQRHTESGIQDSGMQEMVWQSLGSETRQVIDNSSQEDHPSVIHSSSRVNQLDGNCNSAQEDHPYVIHSSFRVNRRGENFRMGPTRSIQPVEVGYSQRQK